MSQGKRLAAYIIDALGGFRIFQRINRNKTQILMYHRIIDNDMVRGMPLATFERQLNYLSHHFRVVPIQTLIQELQTSTVKANTVSLTFDDGHFDFYQYAWPLLKKYKLPATLYITTGFVNGDCWLWPDLIKYILVNSPLSYFDCEPLGRIETGEALPYSWNRIGDYCLTLDASERNEIIRQLADAANVTIPVKPVEPFSPVTWDQLRQMQSEGLAIGSHTFSHPLLNKLDQQDLHYELAESARMIERELGFIPPGICYPNGRPEDINHEVIREAESTGYTYGLLARNYPHNPAQPFLLGRISAHHDFLSFKWSLSHHHAESQATPFHY